MEDSIAAQEKIVPLKVVYRSRLIEQLKEAGIKEAADNALDMSGAGSWLDKMNPFGKKKET